MTMPEMTGFKEHKSVSLKCRKCGIILNYSGYLSHSMDGKLRDKYYYCKECKPKHPLELKV